MADGEQVQNPRSRESDENVREIVSIWNGLALIVSQAFSLPIKDFSEWELLSYIEEKIRLISKADHMCDHNASDGVTIYTRKRQIMVYPQNRHLMVLFAETDVSEKAARLAELINAESLLPDLLLLGKPDSNIFLDDRLTPEEVFINVYNELLRDENANGIDMHEL